MTTPDDPRAERPGRFILVGLASMVLIALFVAVLMLPPLFMYAAFRRGHIALGMALLLGWVLAMALAARRLFGGKPPEEEG